MTKTKTPSRREFLAIYKVKRCPWPSCRTKREHWRRAPFWICTTCGRPSL